MTKKEKSGLILKRARLELLKKQIWHKVQELIFITIAFWAGVSSFIYSAYTWNAKFFIGGIVLMVLSLLFRLGSREHDRELKRLEFELKRLEEKQ